MAETANVVFLPQVLKGAGGEGKTWRQRIDRSGWLRWQVLENGAWATKAALDRDGNLYLAGAVSAGYAFTD